LYFPVGGLSMLKCETKKNKKTQKCWWVIEFSPGYELGYQADYFITYELVLEFFHS
jgi:hypothetical protein